MQQNQERPSEKREDFRRASEANRVFGIRMIASAFVFYLLWGIVQNYIQGGPDAPSLTLLIVSIVLLGGGAAFVAVTSYRTWKRAKAAAQMTQEEIGAKLHRSEADIAMGRVCSQEELDARMKGRFAHG